MKYLCLVYHEQLDQKIGTAIRRNAHKIDADAAARVVSIPQP